MQKLIDDIEKHKPFDELENCYKSIFLNVLRLQPNPLTREGAFHLTASAFVVNKERSKVLCIFHNIYKSWGWMGGHADGETDPVAIARREACEESGIKNLKLIGDSFFALNAMPIDAHVRHGKQVLPHVHLDVASLFEADENEPVRIQKEENSGVAWLEFDELLAKSTEPHMVPIYEKIIKRLKKDGI